MIEEYEDYGDELLAQEPINQAAFLPANETEFPQIKEPEELQPNTTEES